MGEIYRDLDKKRQEINGETIEDRQNEIQRNAEKTCVHSDKGI